jgi:hypothetical protein
MVGSLLVIVGAILASRRETRATPAVVALVEENDAA